MATSHKIRTFGDPVLRSKCPEIAEIDATIVKLAEDMIDTMYAYRGVGVAAPQVGVNKAMFVWDDGAGSGAHVMINPRLIETSGTWSYEEGCLSVPGMFFTIERPEHVVMEGLDLDGNGVRIEAGELRARILQHEFDHLQGNLLLTRLDDSTRKKAMRDLRNKQLADN